MIPTVQTIMQPPTGNCLAACVASLLEIPLWLVPNFAALDRWGRTDDGGFKCLTTNEDGSPCWWESLKQFSIDWGYRVVMLGAAKQGENVTGWALSYTTECLAIATGPSPRGNYDHCVVAEVATGRVAWDPFPGAKPGRQLYQPDVIDWLMFYRALDPGTPRER